MKFTFLSKSTEISLITVQPTCMLAEALKRNLIQKKVIGIPGNFQSHEWFQMTSRKLIFVQPFPLAFNLRPRPHEDDCKRKR